MVKRRVATFLDEEIVEKLKEKSVQRYGKQSVYRIVADLVLEGLDDIEQELRGDCGGTGATVQQKLQVSSPLTLADVERMSEGEVRYRLASSKGKDYKLLLERLLELKLWKRRGVNWKSAKPY